MDSKTLALYLGCPVMAVTSKLGEHKRKLVGVYDDGEVQSAKLWFAGGISDWDFDDFKLLLRPLSSMTEEEDKECRKMVIDYTGTRKYGDSGKRYIGDKKKGRFQYDTDFLIMKYLLSKGFDLFGLIEKGEALDSTSQPEGNTVNTKQ